MKPNITLALALLSWTALSCSASYKSAHQNQTAELSSSSVEPPSSAPVTLLMMTEISGEVMGRRLSEPTAVRVDTDGFVYLIDRGNQRLLKFTPELEAVREWGGFGSHRGQFQSPVSLALDNSLNLYVTDDELRNIQRFDQRLNYVDDIDYNDDEDGLKFGRPAGVAVTVDGEVWISDADRSRIAVFDQFHSFKEFFADHGSGGVHLMRPGALVRLDDGMMAICDEERGRVVLFDIYGSPAEVIGESVLSQPADLAGDSQGRIWVCDRQLDEVLCFSRSGALLFRTGSGRNSGGFSLTSPSGIALIDETTLLISDTGGQRLLKLKIITLEG